MGEAGPATMASRAKVGTSIEDGIQKGRGAGRVSFLFFFNRWLHRISRILAVLDYEGGKQATPEVLRPKRKSSAHFTMT